GTNKVYDGTTAATVTLANNRIPGDVIGENYVTASFIDPNAATNKRVVVVGITISGADAANYSLVNTSTTATSSITPAPLTVTANNQTMVYGSPPPALTASFSGLVDGDTPGDLTGLTLTSAPTNSRVGAYAIDAAGAIDPNYLIHFVPGTLT